MIKNIRCWEWVCYFIVKNLSRVVGQRLPSRCQTHAVEGASFLGSPWNQPDSARSVGRFNILYFVLSMLQNTSKNDFDVRFFPPCHFLWNFFLLSSQSLMSMSLPSRVPLASSVESWRWQCQRSHNQLLILEPYLHSAPISLPALPLFNSLWKFHLCWSIPSSDYPCL